MNVCVIPARGGSKRIPRKNIKLFAGKPIIAYAIEAAKNCSLFDHIVVSTDDPEIADIAQSYGAEIPFLRPVMLADDHSKTVDVVIHSIISFQEMGLMSDLVCCIYPVVPCIQSDDIKDALDLLLNTSSAAYSFPVTEFVSTIQRGLRRDHSGFMKSFYPEFEQVRTQDLEKAYHDAGQFYWGYRNSWLNIESIHNNGVGLVIPNWRVFDIDTPQDWMRAELLYGSLFSKTQKHEI